MSSTKITKAVIPAAGLGTRFIPATKAMPKEMLPVVDKPAIQYVVEEVVKSGLSHVLMITGRNKNALENHFDRAIELEHLLLAKGDSDRLKAVEEATELADLHYVRQGNPLGLGHAVLKAETFVGDESFALLLGDDLIHESETLLNDMLSIASSREATVVALMEVPEEDVSKYGIASLDNASYSTNDPLVTITGFVEKPELVNAPSRLAVIGRYVLRPDVFRVLHSTKPGKGGEIQLTDALETMARNPYEYGPVLGLVFDGRRFDTGDKLSYLKAIIELAYEREDLGKPLSEWLESFTANNRA